MSNGTIRDEMATLRSAMRFAASKRHIRNSQVFTGKLPVGHAARNSRPTNTVSCTLSRRWMRGARNEAQVAPSDRL